MKKTKFIILKIEQLLIPLCIYLFTIFLVLFSSDNLVAAKNGLSLWAFSVVPSLLPFFIATELLSYTNIVSTLGKFLNCCMRPIFNVPGEGSFALIMGIISGYPVGAKIATSFREKNICTKEECERLLSFTNNSGPLFIIGTVGILMFRSTTIGILLFITHILACITVGIIFRFWKNTSNTELPHSKSSKVSNSKFASLSNLGEVLAESINSSISTILLIGGFVVIFSSVISILKTGGIFNILTNIVSPIFNCLNIDINFAQGLFTGFLEITNGINVISSIICKKISINLIFTAFLLGFGGISVFLKVLIITSKTDLSIKPYIYGKLLHGLLAAFYTYIFINMFPFFNFDL